MIGHAVLSPCQFLHITHPMNLSVHQLASCNFNTNVLFSIIFVLFTFVNLYFMLLYFYYFSLILYRLPYSMLPYPLNHSQSQGSTLLYGPTFYLPPLLTCLPMVHLYPFTLKFFMFIDSKNFFVYSSIILLIKTEAPAFTI